MQQIILQMFQIPNRSPDIVIFDAIVSLESLPPKLHCMIFFTNSFVCIAHCIMGGGKHITTVYVNAILV